jgi:peptidoglycan/xylan/chitin deacetylase (PgdA/CDA1 family)
MGVAVVATMAGLVLIVVGLVGLLPRTNALPESVSSGTIPPSASARTASARTAPTIAAVVAQAAVATTAGDTTQTPALISAPDTPPVPTLGDASDARATAETISHLEGLDISSYLGREVKRGSASTGMVALTFDDGPSANTEAVLAALKAAGVRATFFFVGGRAKVRETEVRDALAAGCEIGDHTYSHVELTKLTFTQFDAEVGRAARLLREVSGYAPKLVRPRSGKFDAAALSFAARLGLVLVDWNIHSGDTDKKATVASISANASRAPAGSIVLMHETRKETVEAVPAIVATLKARGLRLVTVSELLAASSR